MKDVERERGRYRVGREIDRNRGIDFRCRFLKFNEETLKKVVISLDKLNPRPFQLAVET